MSVIRVHDVKFPNDKKNYVGKMTEIDTVLPLLLVLLCLPDFSGFSGTLPLLRPLSVKGCHSLWEMTPRTSLSNLRATERDSELGWSAILEVMDPFLSEPCASATPVVLLGLCLTRID